MCAVVVQAVKWENGDRAAAWHSITELIVKEVERRGFLTGRRESCVCFVRMFYFFLYFVSLTFPLLPDFLLSCLFLLLEYLPSLFSPLRLSSSS